MNIIAKESKHRTYKKGDILFIATKDGMVNSKGIGVLYGYQGSWSLDEKYHIDNRASEHKYDNYLTQIIILSMLNGYSKSIKYSSLDKNTKNKFEIDVVYVRVTGAILKNKRVTYDGMIVDSYKLKNGDIILSGFDEKTKNEMPKKLINDRSQLKDFKISGKPVETDPFK